MVERYTVFKEILPPWAVSIEAPQRTLLEELAAADQSLSPAEVAVTADMVPGRRAEYAAVRSCARRGLKLLGRPAESVLNGPDRAPVWPDGVVGSMPHCPGYRAAVVALTRDVVALGIDAEPNTPLPAGVLPYIASRAEIASLMDLPPDGTAWDRMLFSTKEAVFKAWFPHTHVWLDFLDVTISIYPERPASGHSPQGAFSCSAVKNELGTEWFSSVTGRWTSGSTHVGTAAFIV